jgi:hypothetical protein
MGVRRGRELLAFSEGLVYSSQIHLALPQSTQIDSPSHSPRSCIGKAFALAEIKVCPFVFILNTRLTSSQLQALTVTLLQQFSFSCPHEIEAFQSFVVRPRVKGQGPSSLPLLVRKL